MLFKIIRGTLAVYGALVLVNNIAEACKQNADINKQTDNKYYAKEINIKGNTSKQTMELYIRLNDIFKGTGQLSIRDVVDSYNIICNEHDPLLDELPSQDSYGWDGDVLPIEFVDNNGVTWIHLSEPTKLA